MRQTTSIKLDPTVEQEALRLDDGKPCSFKLRIEQTPIVNRL